MIIYDLQSTLIGGKALRQFVVCSTTTAIVALLFLAVRIGNLLDFSMYSLA